MNGFQNSDGLPILEKMVEEIQRNKDYLGDIDGLIGDGDHGMNMNKGFTMFGKRMEGREGVPFTQGLSELGMVLMDEIGGSMGPIYGTMMLEMSEAADGAERIDMECFRQMLQSARAGLETLIEARKGDKTLMDTFLPAEEAIEAAKEQGKSFSEALVIMKDAAANGCNATKEMAAKFGRSSRLGERSRGVLDAGAVSCCILLHAMADGMLRLLSE